MKAKIEGLTAQGNGVYEDKKGRSYIADRKNRSLYLIDKDSRKQLSFFQSRHMVPVILLIMVGFYFDWYLAVGLAVASYVILELIYRKVYLPRMTRYDDVDIPAEPTLKDNLNDFSTGRLVLIAVLSVVMMLMLMVNVAGTAGSFEGLLSNPAILIMAVVSIGLCTFAIRVIWFIIQVLIGRKKS